MYYTTDRQSYEDFYSQHQREKRRLAAARQSEEAVTEALRLFIAGDDEAARKRLADADFSDESIDYYIRTWRN